MKLYNEQSKAPLVERVIINEQLYLDDVMAAAFIVYNDEPTQVELAQEVTSDDLSDPTVALVGIGEKYQPNLNNFDHADPGLPCSTHLVAKANGYDSFLEHIAPWWNFIDNKDRKGIDYALESEGVSGNVVALASPIEIAAVSMLRDQKSPMDYNHPIVRMLSGIGGHYMWQAGQLRHKVATMIDKCEIVQNGSYPIFVVGLQATRQNINAISFLREQGTVGDFDISLTLDKQYDRRWSMYRYPDVSEINFAVLQHDPDMHTVHHEGFVASTAPNVGRTRAIELVQKATEMNVPVQQLA